MQHRIEAAKLNGVVVGKKTVEIEKVVPAVVIMAGTAFAVAFIPEGLNLRKAAGLYPNVIKLK